MAYSPFGSTGSPMFKAEPVVKVAEKKGVSPGTILLSYNGMFLLNLSLFFLLSWLENRNG